MGSGGGERESKRGVGGAGDIGIAIGIDGDRRAGLLAVAPKEGGRPGALLHFH